MTLTTTEFLTEFHLSEDKELTFTELTEIWARRAKKLAQLPETKTIGQTLDLLIFRLENERYGIDVSNVREIYPMGQLTRVPRTPNFVVGVFSARGRILSVIDLRAFLGLSPLQCNENCKIIVVINTNLASPMAHLEVGLLAHEVQDVAIVFKDQLNQPLVTRNNNNSYTQGITQDLVEVLDLSALLDDRRLVINDEVK